MTADSAVSPRSGAKVIKVLTVCHANDVPVTTRGTGTGIGTGNHGQAMTACAPLTR